MRYAGCLGNQVNPVNPNFVNWLGWHGRHACPDEEKPIDVACETDHRAVCLCHPLIHAFEIRDRQRQANSKSAAFSSDDPLEFHSSHVLTEQRS